MKKILIYLILGILAFSLGIIFFNHTSQPHENKTGKIVTLATIFPIKDMVDTIGGDYVICTSILPPAANPHTFEPTPKQVEEFSRADIVFKIGLGFEYWSDQLLAGLNPSPKVVILSDKIEPLTDRFHHAENNNKETNANPHIWLDPVNAITMCQDITTALIKQDPAHKHYFENNFNTYKVKLEKLNTDILTQVARFPQKKYVTFHPTWGYFDRRYGTECVGVIEQSTGKEPTPLLIKTVIDSIKNYGIKEIIAEPQFNAKTARIIAQETAAEVIFLDSIGDPLVPSKNSYINLMYTDVAEMQKVFK